MTATAAPLTLTAERAHAVFARLAELHRSQDPAGVAHVFTADAVYEDDGSPVAIHGVPAIEAFFASVWAAFSDFRVELLDGPYLHADGFSVRGRLTGRMTGDLHPPGFAATHGPVDTEFAGFYELSGERIRAGRVIMDTSALGRQIGAVPPAGSGGERLVTLTQRLRVRARSLRPRRAVLALQVFMARRVAAVPERWWARIERGPARRAIVAALRLIMRLRVNRRLARESQGVIELRLRRCDGTGTDHLHIVLDGRRCRVRRGPSPRPTAALTTGLADLLRMAAGAVATPRLLQDGRLSLIGDVLVIMRFPAVFRLPTRALV